MKYVTLLNLFKAGVPQGMTIQTGKRGGTYYLGAGGKKIYVKQGLKGGVAKQVAEKIGTMKKMDEVTSAIFGIDKLVNQGKLAKEEVDSLYQAAENRMRQIESGIVGVQQKKYQARKKTAEHKRQTGESAREGREERAKAKYGERIGKMKERIGRWKGIKDQLTAIKTKADSQMELIKQRARETQPELQKMNERKTYLKQMAQKIRKGHPQFPQLQQAVAQYQTKQANMKKRIQSLNTAKANASDKLSRIEAITKKADRIINDYIKEAGQQKRFLLG